MAHHDGTRALVINDGSLAAAAASLMELERRPVVAWIPPCPSPLSTDDPAVPTAGALVEKQADLFGYEEVLRGASPTSAGPERRAVHSTALGLEASILLLEAVVDAAEAGAGRVVWPIVAGADLDAMHLASERAQLVSRLAWLDERRLAGLAVAVETPLVDLTAEQVADLARDLDVPKRVARPIELGSGV